jgi:hypothetical protein
MKAGVPASQAPFCAADAPKPPLAPSKMILENSPSAPTSQRNWHRANEGNEEEFLLRFLCFLLFKSILFLLFIRSKAVSPRSPASGGRFSRDCAMRTTANYAKYANGGAPLFEFFAWFAVKKHDFEHFCGKSILSAYP